MVFLRFDDDDDVNDAIGICNDIQIVVADQQLGIQIATISVNGRLQGLRTIQLCANYVTGILCN